MYARVYIYIYMYRIFVMMSACRHLSADRRCTTRFSFICTETGLHLIPASRSNDAFQCVLPVPLDLPPRLVLIFLYPPFGESAWITRIPSGSFDLFFRIVPYDICSLVGFDIPMIIKTCATHIKDTQMR